MSMSIRLLVVLRLTLPNWQDDYDVHHGLDFNYDYDVDYGYKARP